MKKVNKKLIIIIAAVLVIVGVVLAIVLGGGNAKVPGKKNDGELNKEAEILDIIEDGELAKMEDVTAITGATSPDGQVVDAEGILDKEGHRIYATGQKDAQGLMIYTTGKMDSKGNILYTKNITNSFDNLIYYTGTYDADGKLILKYTTERPDYTSNEKPNPYRPVSTTATVTVPLNTTVDANITGTVRDNIKFFGGRGIDNFVDITETEDGGYVAVGYSASYDGDLEGTSKEWAGHGIVVKYDAAGNVLWKYVVGGDSEIGLNGVAELKDGTIVAVGYTMSAEMEPKKNSKDHSALVIRLKKNGDVMWTYSFPGSATQTGEFIQCVAATPDGGFVVGGKAESNEGFFKGGEFARKAFLFKFDKNCNIEWRRILSGSMSNNFMAVDVSDNGDIYATCVTASNDGDFAGIKYEATTGALNTVLVKLNKNGKLEWKHYLEGSGKSEFTTVTATKDGGCVVGGTFSVKKRADGIYTMTYGKTDGYVIRYNKSGEVHWVRLVGGSGSDYITDITEIDGGFVIVGRTDSMNNDFAGEVLGGEDDGFIMCLNEKGETGAKLIFEGKTADTASSVCTLGDGRVVVAGSTTSKDGFFRESGADKQYKGYVATFTTQYTPIQ